MKEDKAAGDDNMSPRILKAICDDIALPVTMIFRKSIDTGCVPWAPARGEQGGQAPTLEKIRVGIAHPGNFSRGLKTSWQ